MIIATIEHIALYTDDLEASKAFYSRYFGAQAGPMYVNAKKGFASYFLSFGGGCRLEIMSLAGIGTDRNEAGSHHLGLSHFAISLGDEHAVNALTKRLAADGYRVIDGPRRTGDGYYESVVLDPGNNRLEITA